jgi:hypothetical protein
VVDTRTDLLSVAKVDQGKLVFVIENYIIRLDVQMGEAIGGMKIENSRAQLLDQKTL